MTELRHVKVKNLLDPAPVCGYCHEPWPCLTASARDAFMAVVRGEITVDQMEKRIVGSDIGSRKAQ